MVICLLIMALCPVAQEIEKPALLVKEVTAETSFPAFNRQVSASTGLQNTIRIWQTELPSFDVKMSGAARYVVSVCTQTMGCWQVGLRSPQQEIMLAKVVLRVLLEDVSKSGNSLDDKFVGYAISESLQSEALKSLLDAWQNALLITSRTIAQKLNPHATPLLTHMFSDEKEYITTNYGSMGMFAPLVPNPIEQIQLYKTPDLSKVYLSSYPPILQIQVKGLDSYGDETPLDNRKLKFLLHDGKKETLLPRAEFKPWRVGVFSLRALYPSSKERDMESPPLTIDVTRIEALLIAPTVVEIAPQESYTFVVAGRDCNGGELSIGDLADELVWKIVPATMAAIEDQCAVKAGVAPGECRLVISVKSNPNIQAEAKILIREPK
jgi:hypothetical protein